MGSIWCLSSSSLLVPHIYHRVDVWLCQYPNEHVNIKTKDLRRSLKIKPVLWCYHGLFQPGLEHLDTIMPSTGENLQPNGVNLSLIRYQVVVTAFIINKHLSVGVPLASEFFIDCRSSSSVTTTRKIRKLTRTDLNHRRNSLPQQCRS